MLGLISLFVMAPVYYDEIAKGYDELHGEEQLRKLGLISSSVDLNPDDLLLDVGCGSGLAFDFFDCKYVGLDPSFELLKRSEGFVVQGVAESLPFRDDVFDVVLCVSAIHNFDDPVRAVEEMLRVGKDRFVITVFKKGDESKVSRLVGLVEDFFDVQIRLEDEHDLIFFCK